MTARYQTGGIGGRPRNDVADRGLIVVDVERERIATVEIPVIRLMRRQHERRLQIGFLRMTGRLLEALRMVPPVLWRHLGAQFEIDAPDLASLRTMYRRRRTLFEQQDLTCSVLGFHDVTEAQRRALVRAINAELSRTGGKQWGLAGAGSRRPYHFVVPLTATYGLLAIRQYRHGAGVWTIEIPAGKIDGREEAAQVGARELTEETGATFDTLVPLGFFECNPALQNNRGIAERCVPNGQGQSIFNRGIAAREAMPRDLISPHEIALADGYAVVAQNGVRRGDVKHELWQAVIV
jgi:hypothetical protein